MRVLIFSDLHCHAFKPYSTILPSGVNSRLQDTLDIIEQIKVISETQDIGLILFGGDLFHVRRILNVQTYNLVFQSISRLRTSINKPQVGLLVGNHDQTDRSGNIHSIYSFGVMVEVMDKIRWTTFKVGQEQIQILPIPHFASKQETISCIKDSISMTRSMIGPSILLGHFGISGALVGSNFVLTDRELMELDDVHPDYFDQVFLGHYHETQQLAPNVRYVGAPIQHNWGDSGQDRGCLIWDTGTNHVDFVHLNYPKFVKMNLEELSHLPNLKVEGDFIRVICPTGSRPINEDELKNQLLGIGARTVEFIEEISEHKSVLSVGQYQVGMDMEDMICDFVNNSDSTLDSDSLIDTGLDIYRSVSAEEKR